MKALEVHHIQPLYQGGKDTMDNCIVLCTDCHRHLKIHSMWEYYHVVILNWKIKSDKDVLDKIPRKYRKSIIDAGMIVNYKLLSLTETLEGLKDKETAYIDLMSTRNRRKTLEHDKSLIAYNRMCVNYDFYHEMLNAQISSCFYGTNIWW